MPSVVLSVVEEPVLLDERRIHVQASVEERGMQQVALPRERRTGSATLANASSSSTPESDDALKGRTVGQTPCREEAIEALGGNVTGRSAERM